jgi:DNA replication protein DnaC
MSGQEALCLPRGLEAPHYLFSPSGVSALSGRQLEQAYQTVGETGTKSEPQIRQRGQYVVGPTGTGKTHIAIALGTTLINNGKKARFFNAVDLINALIKEQAEGNAGKIIRQLSALSASSAKLKAARADAKASFADA